MQKEATFRDFGFTDPPHPYWIASTKSPGYPALEEDLRVDAAIVGGGIVGITTAYLLKKENLKVALLEADRLAQGTTAHTTAKITSQHSLIYSKLIQHHGMEKARQYADANEAAIRFIGELVKAKEIPCDFSPQSAYLYTQSDDYIQKIQDEVDAAASLGIKASYTEDLPLPFPVKAAEVFTDQAQFHPLKYVLALAREIPGEGSYIFEKARAVDFHEGNPCTVVTEGGHKVLAENLIIASHFPAYGSNGYYFARMYPEKSYALGVKIEEEFPGGMYFTAEDPGRGLRSTPFEDGELVIVSGEHHKTGQGPNTNLHYKNLVDFANATYRVAAIPFRWSTQDYTTLDDVPYVGKITGKSPRVYVATGFKKWGMTNGTASAILLKDLIVKGKSPWSPVYDPSRFAADPMIKEFVTANVDVAKHLIGDKLKGAPKETELSPGEARVVEKDGGKVGLYRDEKGQTHAVNFSCTHMGCDLAWNAAELSWDCPCHGSRFTYEGDIIEGPALKSLRTDDPLRFNP